MVTEAYPKLDPSSPLATSVNCRAASRVRLIERELVDMLVNTSNRSEWDTHASIVLTNLSFAATSAFDGTKSFYQTETTIKQFVSALLSPKNSYRK